MEIATITLQSLLLCDIMPLNVDDKQKGCVKMHKNRFCAPMMLMMDTGMITEEGALEAAVKDIAEHGFDAVCMEFRNCILSESDPLGRNAMERVCAAAEENGIDAVKTIPAQLTDCVRKNPSIRRRISKACHARVTDGYFRADLPAAKGKAVKIIKAFFTDGAVKDVTNQINCRFELDAQPYMQGLYQEDGTLLIYVEFETDEIDYAYEGIKTCIERHISLYDGLTLSGFALDEFGAGTKLEHVYHTGEWFLNRFYKEFGYGFQDVIYKMDTPAPGAAKVRHDYYYLTYLLTYEFQKTVQDSFEKQFGKEIFIGFHNTWWGEGNSGDLWAGNIGYFGLTKALSGGFVDAQYDAQRTMLSMTLLSESLAKYSDTGIAYNMCWDRFPTHEKMDYYHRYLAMRNVRWIGHGYGRTGSFGPGYPHHSTWEDAKICTMRERKMQAFYNGAVSKPKAALLYLWEGLSYFNDSSIHFHRLGMKALLEKVQLAGIELDVICELDEDAADYDVLFLSWPAMLPQGMMEKVEQLAEMGKQIIFLGTPVFCDTAGHDLSKRFETLTGCKAGERTAYAQDYEYVANDLWFTKNKIPMQMFPIAPKSAETVAEINGTVCGVKKGSVSFYSFEAALTETFDSILRTLKINQNPFVQDGVLSKLAYGDGFEIFCLCGIWNKKITGTFPFKGHEFQVDKADFVGIKVYDNGTVTIAAPANCTVFVDGEKITPDIIV